MIPNPHTSQSKPPLYESGINAVISLLIFSVMAVFAHRYDYFPFDLWFSQGFQKLASPILDTVFAIVSFPGYPPQAAYFTGAVFILFILARWWKEAAMIVVVSWLIGTVAYPTKYIVDRPRPSPDLIHVVNQGLEGGKYSFPAGHVLVYTSLWGFVWYAIRTKLKPSLLKSSILTLISIFIILIGFSRVYMGEHWISDSIGGYLIGFTTLSIAIVIYHTLDTKLITKVRKRIHASL